MNGTILTSLALSLVLTLALETGLFLLIGKRNRKDLLLLLLVNVITNPTVVLSYWLAALYTYWDARIILIPLELLAILIEGYHYKKYGCDFRRPFLFSIAANMFSFLVGVLIQHFI